MRSNNRLSILFGIFILLVWVSINLTHNVVVAGKIVDVDWPALPPHFNCHRVPNGNWCDIDKVSPSCTRIKHTLFIPQLAPFLFYHMCPYECRSRPHKSECPVTCVLPVPTCEKYCDPNLGPCPICYPPTLRCPNCDIGDTNHCLKTALITFKVDSVTNQPHPIVLNPNPPFDIAPNPQEPGVGGNESSPDLWIYITCGVVVAIILTVLIVVFLTRLVNRPTTIYSRQRSYPNA